MTYFIYNLHFPNRFSLPRSPHGEWQFTTIAPPVAVRQTKSDRNGILLKGNQPVNPSKTSFLTFYFKTERTITFLVVLPLTV